MGDVPEFTILDVVRMDNGHYSLRVQGWRRRPWWAFWKKPEAFVFDAFTARGIVSYRPNGRRFGLEWEIAIENAWDAWHWQRGLVGVAGG